MTRKVLQISHDFKGPFVAICRQFVDAFPSDQVTTVFLRGEFDADVAEEIGGSVYFLEKPGENLRGFKISQIVRLYQLIQSDSFDVVIGHRYKGIYMAGIMSYFCDLPLLLGIAHEHNVFKRITRKLFVTFWRRQFHIAGVSQSVTTNIAQYCPSLVSEKRLHTLPNALPRGYEAGILSRADARRLLGLADDMLVIGSIGRLIQKKSLHILIEAFAKARMDQSAIVILGDGPLRESLESSAVSLGIADRVQFLGYVKNAGYFAAAFDLFVLPSGVEEAFGIVLLEAMMAKVPVISSDAPGPREVIADQGWLFRAEDSDDLSIKLKAFVELPAKSRTLMGQSGYERVRAEYTHEQFADRLNLLLDRL
jgi:glycosyltransferase involved in cell wall biosynthesis